MKPKPTWMKICPETKNIIKRIFNEDVLGNTYCSQDAEIDHRMPENIRRKRGVAAVKLTEKTVKDGSWIEHYQIVHERSNKKKREACGFCQRGNEIPLTIGLAGIRSAYKKRYDEDNLGCLGCWWHDPLRPKRPELLPDLEQARSDQDAKLEKIKEILTNQEKQNKQGIS
jgi:hypothetical protein